MKIISVNLSEEQNEMLLWVEKHYKQLLSIKTTGVLDKGPRSFTVHLKDCPPTQVPEIDKIELHESYYPFKVS